MNNIRINTVGQIIQAGMFVFLLYYVYKFLGTVIPFAFTKPELWNSHWMVNGDVTVPMGARVVFFLMWSVAALATCIMVAFAIWAVQLVRMGQFFEQGTIRCLRYLGISTALAAATVTIGSSIEPWMITRFNETDKRDIFFWYDSGEVGLFLTGLGLILLAWMMKVAHVAQRENREFV